MQINLSIPSNLSVDEFKREVEKHYSAYFKKEDKELIDQALKISEEALKKIEIAPKQENLWRHTLEYVFLLTNLQVDLETILAGILHHVPSSVCDITKMEAIFGKKVAMFVSCLGQAVEFNEEEKGCIVANEFCKNLGVITLRLVHRLHFLLRCENLPKEKQKQLASETIKIYIPITNKLGIYRLQQAFEDESLRILHPKVHRKISGAIKYYDEEDHATLNLVMSSIKEELAKEGIKTEVEARKKSVFSIYMKMVRKKRPLSELFDILGVRVIANDLYDCYNILRVIHTKFQAIPGKFKDYISSPKNNNYQSIHTIIYPLKGVSYKPIEMQIKTKEMHENAQYGSAAHWRYTAGRYYLYSEEDQLKWMEHILTFRERTHDYKGFVAKLRSTLNGKEGGNGQNNIKINNLEISTND